MKTVKWRNATPYSHLCVPITSICLISNVMFLGMAVHQQGSLIKQNSENTNIFNHLNIHPNISLCKASFAIKVLLYEMPPSDKNCTKFTKIYQMLQLFIQGI